MVGYAGLRFHKQWLLPLVECKILRLRSRLFSLLKPISILIHHLLHQMNDQTFKVDWKQWLGERALLWSMPRQRPNEWPLLWAWQELRISLPERKKCWSFNLSNSHLFQLRLLEWRWWTQIGSLQRMIELARTKYWLSGVCLDSYGSRKLW